MRVLLTILSLLSISFSALAREKCNSLNLAEEVNRIENNSDFTSHEKSSIIAMTKSAKVSQILACAALRHKISREDSQFAIVELEKDNVARIAQLQKDLENVKSLLQDDSIKDWERDVYVQALDLYPKRMVEENAITATVIRHIKRATD